MLGKHLECIADQKNPNDNIIQLPEHSCQAAVVKELAASEAKGTAVSTAGRLQICISWPIVYDSGY